MSLAVLNSRAIIGVSARLVRVEVHLCGGLPSFTIVGLADAEVKESRERVRAAIHSSGLIFPAGRVTVNLAPADLPKDSGRFDLPIALGVLLVSGQIAMPELVSAATGPSPASAFPALQNLVFAGELSLSGALVGIHGAVIIALDVQSHQTLILPHSSAHEVAMVPELNVLGARSLLEVVNYLSQSGQLTRMQARCLNTDQKNLPCLSDVHGQATAKRALEVAAAGAHSLLLLGPPGVGKSMIARRLPGILPSLEIKEALEVAAISAYSGQPTTGIDRPFRSPHHRASVAAVIGGGMIPLPGEVTLAHRGVLFLDELAEFDRHVLEGLREPLEALEVMISRARHKVVFPADFQLIAAMNPCPCGFSGFHRQKCRCSAEQVRRYQMKLSGPLLDRIDMILTLSLPDNVVVADMGNVAPEPSCVVRERVRRARDIAMARQQCVNARLKDTDLLRALDFEPEAQNMLKKSAEHGLLSVRVLNRISKVSRTCADLDDCRSIAPVHVAEALRYRSRWAGER